jgi:uncharacterized protein YacL
MFHQIIVFVAFMGAQMYFISSPASPSSSKALTVFTNYTQSDNILFTATSALIELQQVKVNYMTEGLNAVKSLSESTSLTDIIWNKFGDVISLIKTVLLLYIMKYFL